MKKKFITMSLTWSVIVLSAHQSYGQIPVLEIIKEGITKVIVAVDLKIQRLQNETIWLQNAQKVLENKDGPGFTRRARRSSGHNEYLISGSYSHLCGSDEIPTYNLSLTT